MPEYESMPPVREHGDPPNIKRAIIQNTGQHPSLACVTTNAMAEHRRDRVVAHSIQSGTFYLCSVRNRFQVLREYNLSVLCKVSIGVEYFILFSIGRAIFLPADSNRQRACNTIQCVVTVYISGVRPKKKFAV